MGAPRKFKTLEELTPDEHLAHLRDGRLPLTDEYREHRRQALADAGIEDDEDESVAVEAMTVDQHFEKVKEANR